MFSSMDFDTATKNLFYMIVSDGSLSPIDFYCTPQKIQALLAKFANLPSNYAVELLKEFSKDQILTLDYHGFCYLIDNMLSKCYPILKDLLSCESFYYLGDQALLENLMINILLCKLIDYDDKSLADLLRPKILPYSIENIITSEQLEDLHANFLTYQMELVAYLSKIPNSLNETKIEEYVGRVRFLMGIFAVCKTPARFYSAIQVARLVFEKFISLRILDTLSKFFDASGDVSLYNNILAIFTMFINLFKYKENFSTYDQIIMKNNLQKDYLQNFIVNLNSIAISAVSSGYFEMNVSYLTYIVSVVE